MLIIYSTYTEENMNVLHLYNIQACILLFLLV